MTYRYSQKGWEEYFLPLSDTCKQRRSHTGSKPWSSEWMFDCAYTFTFTVHT